MLDEQYGMEDILKCLTSLRQHCQTMAPIVVKRRVMDSFDWRLYREGGVIEEVRQGRRVGTGWRKLSDDCLRRPLLPGSAPRFARQFPPGPLQQYLLSILDVRALIPVADIESHIRELHLLNRDEKTVVRLFLEQHAAGCPGRERAALPAMLRMQPVKGYEKHFRRIRKQLQQKLDLESRDESLIVTVLAAIGRQPMDYNAKPDIHLAGDMPAGEAVRNILCILFDTMQANEQGVIGDVDTEFLHDFRVAVRRSRCALKQLGGVLPAVGVERFLSAFAWLGAVTGHARDLDVYMLHLEDYEAALPQNLRGGLSPLRHLLSMKLKREKRQLAGVLRSERYQIFKRDYRTFLEQPSASGDVISKLAIRRIEKMFRRVLREGGRIRAGSPPEALHELRKSCKKLRYLLEFFRHLYGGDEMARLIRSLKKLQDNLGELQDLAVQMAALHLSLQELQAEAPLPEISRRAMEVLVQQLQHRHDAARMAFAARFRKFSSPKNRQRFRQLSGVGCP